MPEGQSEDAPAGSGRAAGRPAVERMPPEQTRHRESRLVLPALIEAIQRLIPLFYIQEAATPAERPAPASSTVPTQPPERVRRLERHRPRPASSRPAPSATAPLVRRARPATNPHGMPPEADAADRTADDPAPQPKPAGPRTEPEDPPATAGPPVQRYRAGLEGRRGPGQLRRHRRSTAGARPRSRPSRRLHRADRWRGPATPDAPDVDRHSSG